MGLGYRFRATSLTCYSPLVLRLRLPLFNECQCVSKRVTSVSSKGGEYQERGNLALKKGHLACIKRSLSILVHFAVVRVNAC